MERTTLADQIGPIMKDTALVPVRGGRVELRAEKMTVSVAGLPEGSTVIDMGEMGELRGIKDGHRKQKCDYLLVCRIGDGDEAVFVELKLKLSNEKKAKEQLRWSLPYLYHLRSVCRVEYGASPRRVPARYVMIGERLGPRLSKQRVSGGHSLPNASHEGITIRRLVGSRLRFSWLNGD